MSTHLVVRDRAGSFHGFMAVGRLDPTINKGARASRARGRGGSGGEAVGRGMERV